MERSLSMKTDEDICNRFAKEFVLTDVSSNVENCYSLLDNYVCSYNENNDENEKNIPYIVHKEEILLAISHVKKSKDNEKNVPRVIYKAFSNLLVIPLYFLFTSIFVKGIVPERFKHEHVIALYKKKGSHFQSSNYRAIFNFPFIVKFFERILFSKILFYLKDLLGNQHGFKHNHSCETAIASVTQDLYGMIDKNKGKAVALFIDFSKTFDSVSLEKLVVKIMTKFCHKLPPYLIKVIISYFTKRTFSIQNGDYKSKIYNISSGVPAGSILGSLFYSLFINDIKEAISVNYCLYADDLILYTDCNNFVEGSAKLNDCLNDLKKWCMLNGLKINISKTKYIVFYKSNDYMSAREPKGCIKLDGEDIELLDNFKYLGIILDSNLNYKSHCELIDKKLSNALAKLYTIKRMVNEKFIKSVLSAYAISTVDYGIIFWANSNPPYVTKFQKKIDRFLIVFFYPTLSKRMGKKTVKFTKIDINEIYSRLEMLTINERKIIAFLKFVFKNLNSYGIFKDWFNVRENDNCMLKRLKVIDKPRTTTYKFCVRWNCLQFWNQYCNKLDVMMKNIQIDERKTKKEIFAENCKLLLLKERVI